MRSEDRNKLSAYNCAFFVLTYENSMENYENLYNWINANYSALQISYINYQGKDNVNFTLYCIAMYVKHQSLFS
jgi:hypothetical protein